MLKFSNKTKEALKNFRKVFEETQRIVFSEDSPHTMIEDTDNYSLAIHSTFTSAIIDAENIIEALCTVPEMTEEDIDNIAKEMDMSVEEFSIHCVEEASKKLIESSKKLIGRILN